MTPLRLWYQDIWMRKYEQSTVSPSCRLNQNSSRSLRRELSLSSFRFRRRVKKARRKKEPFFGHPAYSKNCSAWLSFLLSLGLGQFCDDRIQETGRPDSVALKSFEEDGVLEKASLEVKLIQSFFFFNQLFFLIAKSRLIGNIPFNTPLLQFAIYKMSDQIK